MFEKARLSRPLKAGTVQCRVCEHYCALVPGAWGQCGVRQNRDGELYLAVYGEAIAAHIDPIEKKPLYHFLPGSQALSIGTYGCNMRCRWCQNWQMSQIRAVTPEHQPLGEPLPPQALVDTATRRGCASLAYTYNEPTVFFEYTLDTMQRARAQGVKNVYVTNGFMSAEALEMLAPTLDGANVDLKGFTEALYQEYTDSRLGPVKRNIATMARHPGIWVEVTTLIIPGLNDSDTELRAAAEWLASVGPHIPWHLSAFHPTHKMTDRPRTPTATLERAYNIGKAAGLDFVYVGNVYDPRRSSTYCPGCGELLIERAGFSARTRWQTPGFCPTCERAIPGVWA